MAERRANTLLAARRSEDTAWHGTAFIVEALLLLAFLAFSLAVFMQLFGSAHARSVEERQLTQAVRLASNEAERFAADPQAGYGAALYDAEGNAVATGGSEQADTFVVERETASEQMPGGTLYRASIIVSCEGEAIYELETARYLSDGGRGGDGA